MGFHLIPQLFIPSPLSTTLYTHYIKYFPTCQAFYNYYLYYSNCSFKVQNTADNPNSSVPHPAVSGLICALPIICNMPDTTRIALHMYWKYNINFFNIPLLSKKSLELLFNYQFTTKKYTKYPIYDR